MKLLEKFVLLLYSLLILALSVIICLLVFKVIDINTISYGINFVLSDVWYTAIALGVAVIFILLSIRCLFFRKRKQIKKSNETDILLENESGRLLISKRAIENCVKNVITEKVESTPEIKVTVDIDPASNICIYISVILDKNVKVKEFTIDLQSRIKDRIKDNFDLEVKQINIKIDSAEKVELKKEIQKKSEEKSSLEDGNLIEIKPQQTNSSVYENTSENKVEEYAVSEEIDANTIEITEEKEVAEEKQVNNEENVETTSESNISEE